MNPRLKWLLAVSLALNMGAIGAFVFGKAATQTQPSLPDYLQLNAEQRQRWQQIEPAFLSELARNWQAIRERREALVRQIFSATPDRASIRAEQSTIAGLQDAQQRRVIEQLLAERELLDEGQRRKLMNLLLQRYAGETLEEERLHRGHAQQRVVR